MYKALCKVLMVKILKYLKCIPALNELVMFRSCNLSNNEFANATCIILWSVSTSRLVDEVQADISHLIIVMA